MTFSTEKRKIFRLWNDSIQNQFEIDDLSFNDKIILNKINNLNDTDTVYNNVINLSSDWLIPNTQIPFNNPNFIGRMFQEYSVELNDINSNLIPYIQSKIAYRLGDSDNSLPVPISISEGDKDWDERFDFIKKLNSITEIVPIINEEGKITSKNTIIYRTSISMAQADADEDTGFPAELQLRFFVNIVNPIYYQST